MSISPLETTSTPPQKSSLDGLPKQSDSTEKQSSTEKLSATESRNQRTQQRNLDILEANQKASLSAPGQPLSLLYQTAIAAINAELAPTMGDNAIERTQQEGIDTSPEATAERIVSLTMGSFGRFQEHHPGMDESEQAERFFELVSTGIEQGFGAAKDILEGLSVLEGSIADNIDKTYELVQQGLEQFRQHFSADKAPDGEVSDA